MTTSPKQTINDSNGSSPSSRRFSSATPAALHAAHLFQEYQEQEEQQQQQQQHSLTRTGAEEAKDDTTNDHSFFMNKEVEGVQQPQQTNGDIPDTQHHLHKDHDSTTIIMAEQQQQQVAAPNDLGERVLLGQSHRRALKSDDDHAFGRRMCWTITTLLGLWMGLLVTLISIVLGAFPPDSNTEILFNEFLTENIYEDIVQTTLPSVQRWYRGLPQADKLQLLPRERVASAITTSQQPVVNTTTTTTSNDDCISQFFQELTQVVNETSPAHVGLVLTSLGFNDNLLIQMSVQDLLVAPQPLVELVEATSSCYSESAAMQQLCQAYYQDSTVLPKPDFAIGSQSRAVLTYFANVFAVYQTLTQQASTDMALLTELSIHMIDVMPSREEAYQNTVDDPVVLEFATVKYRGIAQSLHALNQALATNLVPHGLDQVMQINILEATKVDIELGHVANARVGLALAAALQYGPIVEHHVATWKHGRDWTEAYISWNMAFIVGSLGLNRLIKLMIPSVACTPNENNGEGFITPRVISLGLGLMHEFPIQEPLSSNEIGDIPQAELDQIQDFYRRNRNVTQVTQQRYPLAEALGVSTLFHTRLPSPSSDTVERMLYTLCNEACHDATWSFSKISFRAIGIPDDDFPGYLTLTVWITVLLAGLGLELLVWLHLSSSRGWSIQLEKQWWLAQFIFPLLATTCLGLAAHQNNMALIFLVFGLWKFGMPESVSYMYMALYEPRRGRRCNVHFLINLINSVGTQLHHSCASYPIVAMLAGLVIVDRHILDPILILVIQHWFVLTKYMNVYLYSLIELALEVLFEIAVFSELQYLYSRHWSLAVAALGMLLAHWLYLTAATLELWVMTTWADAEQRSSAVPPSVEENVPLCCDGDTNVIVDSTKTH